MVKIPEIPDEFNLSSFLLDRHLKEGRGNKIAVYYKEQKITYAQVAEMANRFGNALLDLGVESENRVMICLPDCPELIAGYFGTMKIGAVPVPVSTMALPQDYLYYLEDSRAKALLIHEDLLPQITQIRQQFRFLKHLIVLGAPKPGQLCFEEIIAKASSNLEAFPTSKDDVAFWLYSSGTTGTPKGVVHLHHDLLYFMTAHCREVVSMTTEDIVFSSSKMYFSYGRNNSIDSVFLTGAAVVLYPGLPKPEHLIELVAKYRPTLFYSVPSSYWAMLNLMDKEDISYDFSSVRVCISSGEALPEIAFNRWKEKTGLEILNTIGSTDVGAMYISNHPGRIKQGSIGTLLSVYEAKLVDENGNEVQKGEIGTLWVKSDGAAAYYWNKHQKTKESFFGEWFNTGDQFYQDEDDFYYYAGRADDMLKAGGIWVSPLEVEEILLKHPAVNECAIVGAPGEANLEKPLAYVVLREGYNPSIHLEQELQQFVRDKTAHYKYPRWIRFVNELPRTASGKIQRYKLRLAARKGI